VVDAWSQDGYSGLPDTDPVRDPDTGSTVARVVRGGSWRDPPSYGLTYARSAMNGYFLGSHRYPDVGFRCAYDR
jgi:formylglycine-generating enzyme required for sulfatase activity